MSFNSEGTKTVAIETLGCKLNLADSETIARQFQAAGFRLVDPGERPDIYILNTCTVTHVADRKSRHLLRMARRRRPDGYVVAAGCYIQRAPAAVSQIPGVDLVVDNLGKSRLVESVAGRLGIGGYCQPHGLDAPHPFFKGLFPSPSSGQAPLRTRTFVKIQEGCNDYCTYCIIPRTRGPSRSISQDDILAEIKQRVAEGCKEVVLTGTQLGDYNQAIPKARRLKGVWEWKRDGENPLALLIKRILWETELPRLRLSSLQSQDITPDLLELWHNQRLCRHLHVPLQSGSDPILRRMRRRYTAAQYAATVDKVRKAVPRVAITTDVIVGFPGEREEEFQESYRFCHEMGFSNIHVFPFSARDGTLAARMGDKVVEEVKRERMEKMLLLAQELGASFRRELLGKTLAVLWEEEKEGELGFPTMPVQKGLPLWRGLTDNYVRVYTQHATSLVGKITPVLLKEESPQGMWGEVSL